MRRSFQTICLTSLIALTTVTMGALIEETVAHAQGSTKGASGLPLPRFVSLKSRRVNIRIGPSVDYAVSWMYTKEGLPMEIIQEYENWRRVRDAEGTEGWVNQALLSGDRSAIAAPWMRGKGKDIFVNMRREAQNSSSVVAKLEPGVIIRIKECTGDWCRAQAGSAEGWVSQGEIWGAYPGEAFK